MRYFSVVFGSFLLFITMGSSYVSAQTAPSLNLSVDKPTINPFEWSRININTNGYRCWLEGGASGSDWEGKWWLRVMSLPSVQPLFTTTYSVECFTISGLSSGKKSVTITVREGNLLLSTWVKPAIFDWRTVNELVVSWQSSADIKSCTASGGTKVLGWISDSIPTSGTRTIKLNENFDSDTLFIECWDVDGRSTGKKWTSLRQGMVEQIHICPSSVNLVRDSSRQLVAYYTNAIPFSGCDSPNGTVINAYGTWSSVAPQTASVTNTGVVKGVANGTTSIRVNYSGVVGEAQIVVTGFPPPPPPPIVLPPALGTCSGGALCETGPQCSVGANKVGNCVNGAGVCCLTSDNQKPPTSDLSGGVISEAQPLSVSLTKILNFLLLVFGLIAILGMIIAGVLYFTAQGDERQIMFAKRAFQSGVVGIVVALGSMVLVWTIAQLLS